MGERVGSSGITECRRTRWVRTEASLRSLATHVPAQTINGDRLLEQILAGGLLPGLMDPVDVTLAYLFLASPWRRTLPVRTLGVDRGEVPY